MAETLTDAAESLWTARAELLDLKVTQCNIVSEIALGSYRFSFRCLSRFRLYGIS